MTRAKPKERKISSTTEAAEITKEREAAITMIMKTINIQRKAKGAMIVTIMTSAPKMMIRSDSFSIKLETVITVETNPDHAETTSAGKTKYNPILNN